MAEQDAGVGAAAQLGDSPAERRKRRVRDQIIEAAEQVFAAEGLGGLSMRRLAERIDYSAAALYKYFRSKDELIDEIREQFFEELLIKLDDCIADRPLDLDCLRDGLRIYIETGLAHPNHYRMGFAERDAMGPPAEGSKQFEAAMRLSDLIALGVENGLFRPMDSQLAAKSVWAALHGVTILMVEIDEFPHGMPGSAHLTREHLIAFHVELIVRGLARVAPTG